MPEAARKGDIAKGHDCFPDSPVIEGSPDVFINGQPAARKGDAVASHSCTCGNGCGTHCRSISEGAPTVFINGKPAATVSHGIDCGGMLISGSGNVNIGSATFKSSVDGYGKQTGLQRSPLLESSPAQDNELITEHTCVAPKARVGIDAGFCIVSQPSTTESFENILFVGNQPPGTRELYRSLNNVGKEYKTGSILLVVDPDKQNSEQISHMLKAKDRIDTALEPLTHQEANFLYKYKDTIDLFTSHASTTTGIASEAMRKYFEKIESILARIQQAYKNQYITSGSLISEQFYVQRRQLFNELDSILTDFTRYKLALQDYPDIKRALGLSTSSITHRWNQTGVTDIEGYATYMEKAAKYVKLMKTVGYVGVTLDGLNRMNKVYEACTVGSDCEKTAYIEVGSFGMAIGGGMGAGVLASASASTTVCSFVLGALTIEAAGVGMLACGVIFTGAAGYAGGEVGSKFGAIVGEKVYEVTK